jgi:3-methyladenine DNA glycosylase AlkD
MKRLANPERARVSARYFKTGAGEYGEGDAFLGLPVPAQRRLARRWAHLPLRDLAALLNSRWHEHRLTALMIVSQRFRKAGRAERDRLARFYLTHRRRINNWDLVDTSAPQVLGCWLLDRPRGILDRLAGSRSLWDRRIAVLATQTFLRHGQFDDTLRLAERLLSDREDLMHKAVGWMLRVAGDCDPKVLRGFLGRHAARMPRTMLRYAIEKLPEPERRRWLAVRLEERRSA